jgi:hypothetical protein
VIVHERTLTRLAGFLARVLSAKFKNTVEKLPFWSVGLLENNSCNLNGSRDEGRLKIAT